MPPETSNPNTRVAIVGVGQVGSAAAYALILGHVANELLLVDIKAELRDAQVRDLADVAYGNNSGIRVRAATYQEVGQCDIVVITAGSKHSRGETTVQHLYHKIAIIRGIVDEARPFRSDTILLIVANPVDLLTSLAQELSGLPKSQVLGSGTYLDSVRIRGLLAERAGVATSSIDAQVVGVHGPSEVVAWSGVTIGGVPIARWFPQNTDTLTDVANECKAKSQTIIRAKGGTPFGIGSVVCSICSSILFDKRDVCCLSHFLSEYKCCISLPVVLGRGGVMKAIDMQLDREEWEDLNETAQELKRTMERLKSDESQ
ncbi:lactate dehydrogenase/glycoside hydrolase [Aspergillus caelatus]|uniref:Lactate dehydrogenase/glycoside hydrolase n=2 Tax=Aspergillus subgen. Circumdati TaxID=2720871 RepID=A0A5N7ALA0_9EURO|nr:lactate dehydrogenase/glycoside hydrolase [Aspergillus caelatus]KAE8369798.1 lactate dehydrogenase/glycoside hydrolase [Aspergillus caelatus]KAE8416256.1 lactate dehydrogenase/glycoside hydrolase [Aspergillus pseudocaelatus]